MTRRTTAVLAGLVIGALATAVPRGTPMAEAQQVPQSPLATDATSTYNLTVGSVAVDGYDPVAYFPEGGGTATKGDARFEMAHNGVTYRFSSKAHLDLFRSNPSKYQPAHGGWCTYAMGKDGAKVEVDPTSYVVAGDRLFLFYKDFFTNTRASFLKDQEGLTAKADANWKRLTGESPRMGTPASLQRQLDELRDRANKAAPAERIAVYEEGIREIAASGVLESALKVGASAPDFTLMSAAGPPVRLAELLKSGPVVLTWYRGGWCPYCNLQLRTYQESLADFKAAGGAHLVAVSPQMPDSSLSTQEKNLLEFAVLSDPGNSVAHQYGVAYRLPESVVNAFKGRLDMPRFNGDDSWELPLPVTYVIGKDSRIAYAFIDADYRKRAEPADILAALRALQSP
ncbi:MAG: redoxin domain-containing protein [Phycisphaeraceae bacterium]|nr:redoxin domain-containing protein [Phycisphaeraceae bacterium]